MNPPAMWAKSPITQTIIKRRPISASIGLEFFGLSRTTSQCARWNAGKKFLHSF